jgi:hypothetical protein
MRRKGKMRKNKQILIRVNNEEKIIAETLSKKENLTVSELFRRLLRARNEGKKQDIHNIIIAKYEEMLEKYRKLYNEYKK